MATKPTLPSEEEIVRSVVMRVARTDVQLQLGRYLTKKQKDERRQRMVNYQIKAPI